MRILQASFAAVVVMAGVTAFADEKSAALKEGPDMDLTTARCSICHTTDYITMNSVFLKRAGWDAEVHKMMKVMGAPISEDEAQRIVAYLTQYYGTE